MTVAKHHDMVLLSDIDELSDEQRAKVLEFFAEHPSGGYKSALTHAGIRSGSHGGGFVAAKEFLFADEEIRRVRFAGWGLSENNVMSGVGEVANDPEHKDRLKALIFGASFHGWRESRGVEHTGSVEVANTDVADAIERFTAAVVHASERRQAELTAGGAD